MGPRTGAAGLRDTIWPYLWGRVSGWSPPHRLAHSWHPGGDPAVATTIEVTFDVTFTALDQGRSRVELAHVGWRPGDEARRAGHATGWPALLQDGYAAHLAVATG